MREPPDASEFAGLVRSGLARLKDAENKANSLDSRFDLAYSPAHALCLAALRYYCLNRAGQLISTVTGEVTPSGVLTRKRPSCATSYWCQMTPVVASTRV